LPPEALLHLPLLLLLLPLLLLLLLLLLMDLLQYLQVTVAGGTAPSSQNRLMPASQLVLIERLLLLLPVLLLPFCGTPACAAASAPPGRPCCSTCECSLQQQKHNGAMTQLQLRCSRCMHSCQRCMLTFCLFMETGT
jgi:hypothetical protein